MRSYDEFARALTLLTLMGLLGCGSPEARAPQTRASSGSDARETQTPATGSAEPRRVDPEPVARRDPRALEAGATYGDLVTALRASEVARSEAATAPCLMTGGAEGQGAHLDAELAAAVHPIPDAPADLASRLSPAPVAILSRYGTRGPSEPGLAVATLSATNPPGDGEQVLIALTSRGALLRSSDRRVEAAGAFPLDELRQRLGAFSATPGLIALTAEASVPLSVLRDALGELPDALASHLTLAVALPPGTRAPSPTAATTARAPLCEYLPPWEPGTRESTLSVSALVTGAGPLREAARDCLASAGPTAQSGSMTVLFRVNARGQVEAACVNADDTGSDALRACVLEHARAMRFPPPSPAGVVQAALPLIFQIDHDAPMHSL
jgi:hypothetical protein